jgi:hypothetical protein
VTQLVVDDPTATTLTWDDQDVAIGPGTEYEVLSGGFATVSGWNWNATCLATAPGATYVEVRPAPAAGELDWYLVRAVNGCGAGDPGSAERLAELPVCP